MRILLIEDDHQLAESLTEALVMQRYVVDLPEMGKLPGTGHKDAVTI